MIHIFIILEPHGRQLCVHLDMNNANLLYSMAEATTRIDPDKRTQEELEFAEELKKELEYYVLNDE